MTREVAVAELQTSIEPSDEAIPPNRMARTAIEPSLPRAAYVDPAYFDRERTDIWHRDWIYVGRLETLEAPGDFLHADVAGERVVVVRTRAGTLAGHIDLCRHRGSRLVLDPPAPTTCSGAPGPAGTFKGVIRCAYHSWTYELDGPVRSAPFLGERDDFPAERFGLHPVAVGTWGGFVFVSLDPSALDDPAASLAAQLGAVPDRLARYPLGDLRIAHRIVYDVAANWKVVAENYNECYHCAGVHPELCRIVPAFRARSGSGLDWDAGVPQAEGTWTFTFSGTSDRRPFPGLSDEEQVRHKGELLYPNFMLSLSADHVAAFMLLPTGPDRTTIVVDWLFHPDEIARPAFDPSDAVDFWDLVNRQDWVVCEAVQSGMGSSRFTVGYYAPMEDMSLDIRRYLESRLGPDAVAVPEDPR
jgi:Rieske 2Fe-2S family protein